MHSYREENDNSKAPKRASNRSKPEACKIIHADVKNAQNGSNKLVRGQSVETHPATTSVISNSKRGISLESQ